MSDQLRLSAYYYSFEPTGVREVDLILSAAAWAGKAYHTTDSWNEETSEYPNCVGKTPIEWIQNAAIAAAAEIERLTAELAEAKAKHYEECAAIADEDDPEMTMTIGDRIRAALTDTKE